jgi:hypothetical protein
MMRRPLLLKTKLGLEQGQLDQQQGPRSNSKGPDPIAGATNKMSSRTTNKMSNRTNQ